MYEQPPIEFEPDPNHDTIWVLVTEEGTRRVVYSQAEADQFAKEKKGNVLGPLKRVSGAEKVRSGFAAENAELIEVTHTPTKYIDAVKKETPTVLNALLAFSGGNASPEIMEALLPAVKNEKILAERDNFEDMTGKRFSVYHKKLQAIIVASQRKEPIPTPSAFDLHSLRLPCGHTVHVSNLELVTTCPLEGRKYSIMELVPLIAKLMDEHPELKTQSTHQRSRFDIFTALRGRK